MQSELNVEIRIKGEFKTHLAALGATVDEAELNRLAQIVSHAMSNKRRLFHRAHHIFELLVPTDPILSLAALFHDVVYFQVDDGFPEFTNEFLCSKVRIDSQGIILRDDVQSSASSNDIGFLLICDIFSVKPGQRLDPLNGLNEFLSAVLAEKYLSPHLPLKTISQIVACIEATIPFRPSVNSMTPPQTFAIQFSNCSQKFNLGFDKKEISEIIKRAVHLANRDVQNFASEDHAWFLATTWLLLPERNESLHGNLFTFADYRKSIQKMVGFFNFLSPDLVFNQFEGFPDNNEFRNIKLRAEQNISIARKYLNAKLIAIGVLEALANLTGGDIPVVEFLGDVKSTDSSKRRMEEYLPVPKDSGESDSIVLSLLQTGRTLESKFDLRNSPLAAYLMRNLNPKQWSDISSACLVYFDGKMNAFELLQNVPMTILTSIVDACSHSCPKRSNLLAKSLKSLSENSTGH